MLLNAIEKRMMNNPVREAIQRRLEARKLLELGGKMKGGVALEVGCGRGVGVQLILDEFGADHVDAFDLDPDMVRRARQRLAHHGARVRLWAGDVNNIAAPDGAYDAVFDFGIIHHVPDWRRALREIARVLSPGGRFYSEEVLVGFLERPMTRALFEHPPEDRFDGPAFVAGMRDAGLIPVRDEMYGRQVGWFVADKRGG